MRLTTKGRYAVTAMLDIALHDALGGGPRKSGTPVSVQEIAERQEIPAAYLEQLTGALKRQGLLQSLRGPGGGYRLGRRAEDISISCIITAVGEGIDATRCAGKADCLTHDLWVDLSQRIDSFLSDITLASLVDRAQERSPMASAIPATSGLIDTVLL